MAKLNQYPTPCLDCGGEVRPPGHGTLTRRGGRWFCVHPTPVRGGCDCGRPNCGGCDDVYDARRDAELVSGHRRPRRYRR